MKVSRESGDDYTKEDVVIDLRIALFGSIDSSNSFLTHALDCVCERPDVIDKTISELQSLGIDKENRSVSYEVAQKMTYVDALADEVLRMSTPFAALYRRTMAEVEIGGYVIPAGWTV